MISVKDFFFHKEKQKGQTLVEFIIIAPLVFFISIWGFKLLRLEWDIFKCERNFFESALKYRNGELSNNLSFIKNINYKETKTHFKFSKMCKSKVSKISLPKADVISNDTRELDGMLSSTTVPNEDGTTSEHITINKDVIMNEVNEAL